MRKMGSTLSSVLYRVLGSKKVKILVIGLEGAGKTTIIYRLKKGETLTNFIPTIGFNVESLEYKSICFDIWEFGGQPRNRLMSRHYFPGTQGFVFVIDSSDRESLEEARSDLIRLLSDNDVNDAPVLILASKQDLPDAMATSEITAYLKLDSFKNRTWHVQATSATTGDGLHEALDWLSDKIKNKSR